MARPHLQSGEITSLQPLDGELAQAGSHALLKSAQLEVLRIVLPAGKTLPRHAVPGEITVQCLEGSAEFITDASRQQMQARDFLHLDGGVAHTITALQDCCLLVTICLLPAGGSPGSPSSLRTARSGRGPGSAPR